MSDYEHSEALLARYKVLHPWRKDGLTYQQALELLNIRVSLTMHGRRSRLAVAVDTGCGVVMM